MQPQEKGVSLSNYIERSATTSTRWRDRPTIKQLISDYSTLGRHREDYLHRIPDSEKVELSAVTLSEAFTPSNVSLLYEAIESLERKQDGLQPRTLRHLDESRKGASGGWSEIGPITRPGMPTLGRGHRDATLPNCVNAVWMRLCFPTPSLAILVATFTLKEGSTELSEALSRNYEPKNNTRIVIPGRLGSIRSLIPWSRPKNHKVEGHILYPDQLRRDTVQNLMKDSIKECESWFYRKFRGKFSQVDPKSRPTVKIILTEQSDPTADTPDWMQDISLWGNLWKEDDGSPWAIEIGEWFDISNSLATTVAANRNCVAQEMSTREGIEATNWTASQVFHDRYSQLVSKISILVLISLFQQALGRTRDYPRNRRFARPVRDALDLDYYLINDGLDAATISSEVLTSISDGKIFEYGLPDPKKTLGQKHEPQSLQSHLKESMQATAQRLKFDTEATEKIVQASAQLRHAISGTRMQRTAVLLSLVATVVAILALMN